MINMDGKERQLLSELYQEDALKTIIRDSWQAIQTHTQPGQFTHSHFFLSTTIPSCLMSLS